MQTNCSGNASFNPVELNDVIRSFFGWLTLPIACVGLFLASLYIIAVARAMYYRRVSRKCYVLLLDRGIGDVFACVVALAIAIYVLSAQKVSIDIVPIGETLLIGSFWSAMFSYVALSLLKLYAVARPLQYRHVITLRRCIYVIAISWIFYLCLVTALFVVMAMVKIPSLNNWSGCTMETCTRTVHRVRHSLIIICYIVTIVVFTLTVVFVNRAYRYLNNLRRKESKNAVDRVLRFSLWKLGMNVGTFALLYIFQVLYSCFILFNRNGCLFVDHKVQMWRLHGIIRNTLLLRIVVDPIISFAMDVQIRKSFLNLLEGVCHVNLPKMKHKFEFDESITMSTNDGRSMSMTQTPTRTTSTKSTGEKDQNPS